MYRIDDDLKDFIESDVATLVGSAESPERPQIAWGWAPRVKDEGVVEVFLDAARADRTIANLRMNPRIAVTMAQPVSYRSVQIKGDFVGVSEPTEDDKAVRPATSRGLSFGLRTRGRSSRSDPELVARRRGSHRVLRGPGV